MTDWKAEWVDPSEAPTLPALTEEREIWYRESGRQPLPPSSSKDWTPEGLIEYGFQKHDGPGLPQPESDCTFEIISIPMQGDGEPQWS